MVVVSNASPLIALSKLGQLALLPALSDQVLIPQAVYEEVVVAGLREGHADAIVVDHFVRLGRIVVRPIELSANDRDWASRIDRGEAEVYEMDIGTRRSGKKIKACFVKRPQGLRRVKVMGLAALPPGGSDGTRHSPPSARPPDP